MNSLLVASATYVMLLCVCLSVCLSVWTSIISETVTDIEILKEGKVTTKVPGIFKFYLVLSKGQPYDRGVTFKAIAYAYNK